MLNGDIPNTLGATALVTNAYLYTGDERYKRWVLEYVDVWLDRVRRNGGIMPDNVGPTGKIGEQRGGQWWGGLYGWYHFGGFNVMFHSLTVAAECALLLSGDFGYLELLRSQLELLLRHARTRHDGQLLVPQKHGPHGWEDLPPAADAGAGASVPRFAFSRKTMRSSRRSGPASGSATGMRCRARARRTVAIPSLRASNTTTAGIRAGRRTFCGPSISLPSRR